MRMAAGLANLPRRVGVVIMVMMTVVVVPMPVIPMPVMPVIVVMVVIVAVGAVVRMSGMGDRGG